MAGEPARPEGKRKGPIRRRRRQAAEDVGIAADLRRPGRPIGKMDTLIAAIALSLGKTTVVSADGDLTAVPGLTVANRSTGKGDQK
jgi:predicted nucleic acid-binding protein